jgi:hypothetical protein
MEVADTEAAATLAGATSPAVTLVAVTSAKGGPVCTLAAPMFASPETAASGIMAAVGPAGIGVADFMIPATRMAGFIRTATGRNEPKSIGVLNDRLALHESSLLFSSVPPWLVIVAQGDADYEPGPDGPRIHIYRIDRSFLKQSSVEVTMNQISAKTRVNVRSRRIAPSTCIKCGDKKSTIVLTHQTGSASRLSLVQCASCGTPLEVIDPDLPSRFNWFDRLIISIDNRLKRQLGR